MTRGKKAAPPVEVVDVAVKTSAITALNDAATELAEVNRNTEVRVRAAAHNIGYQLPVDAVDVDLIQRDITANMRRSVEACLEVGRGLYVLKAACPHGEFLQRLDSMNIESRVAQRFMQAASKFANAASTPLLKSIGNQTKLFEMLVLDDEQIDELILTGQTGELALDDVASMSVKELRAALRKERQDNGKRIKLLEKVNGELQQEAQRIKYEEPADRLMPILQDAHSSVASALGVINGKLRSELMGLLEDGMGDQQAMAAALLGQIGAALVELQGELGLPAIEGAARPAWQQWADAQDAQDAQQPAEGAAH